MLLSREPAGQADGAVRRAGAEQFMFGTCTTGASNDIEQMTKIARSW